MQCSLGVPIQPLHNLGMTTDQTSKPTLPLTGLRVVEFTHMVMGPTCGMVLADMGGELRAALRAEG